MLSLGIDLNTKTQLGISPINSVPFNVHQLTGLPLHARIAKLISVPTAKLYEKVS